MENSVQKSQPNNDQEPERLPRHLAIHLRLDEKVAKMNQLVVEWNRIIVDVARILENTRNGHGDDIERRRILNEYSKIERRGTELNHEIRTIMLHHLQK